MFLLEFSFWNNILSNMRYFANVTLPLLLLATSVSASCPPAEKISPCECDEDYDDDTINVDCTGKDISLQQLKTSLSSLDKQYAFHLLLDEMNLGSLPSDLFKGLNLKVLEISHCELDSLSGDGGLALSGLEDVLEELNIMSSFTENEGLTKLNLGHLRKLSELDLSYNAITELGNDWFEQGPSSLTSITFSNNGIEKIGDQAFANLRNLKSIFLHGNRFGPLKRSMFPNPANDLEELEFDNNALMDVPEDIFSNMPALKKLSLRTNGLKRIPEETFRSLMSQADIIDIRGNPIECDSHLNWLIKLGKASIYGKCEAPLDKRGIDLNDLIAKGVSL